MTPTHVLLTHHHHDHVDELGKLTERWPDAAGAHRTPTSASTASTGDDGARRDRHASATSRCGRCHTPGHTKGMLSLLVEGNVFTGDTLFKNSVGGVRAPGHTTYADLRHSIMDVLLALPPETVIRPGHTEPTTVADGVGDTTRSCASGAAWTPRATSRAPRWASRPRSCCSATTTTAATRPGCAGPTARDDIVGGSQVKRASGAAGAR